MATDMKEIAIEKNTNKNEHLTNLFSKNDPINIKFPNAKPVIKKRINTI